MRKVKFTMSDHSLAYDQISDLERNGLFKEREGSFHKWGKEIKSIKNLYFEQSIGIVEETSTGKIFQVLPKNIIFIP